VQNLDVLLKTGQKIEIFPNLNNDVWVDKNLLNNILMNLLSNAIKFTSEHSTITVSCSLENNNLVLSIRDRGIGISEEDQQHLFERFFRAKNAGNIQGTGLGLHIVAKYLELINGRIEIQSKIDEGSTFTVYISQNISN
jgi:signal transduction histidine kinase